MSRKVTHDDDHDLERMKRAAAGQPGVKEVLEVYERHADVLEQAAPYLNRVGVLTFSSSDSTT